MPSEPNRSRLYTKERMQYFSNLLSQRKLENHQLYINWSNVDEVERYLRSLPEKNRGGLLRVPENVEDFLQSQVHNPQHELKRPQDMEASRENLAKNWDSSGVMAQIDDLKLHDLLRDARNISRVFCFGMGSLGHTPLSDSEFEKHIIAKDLIDTIIDYKTESDDKKLEVWFCDSKYNVFDGMLLSKVMPFAKSADSEPKVDHELAGFKNVV